MGYAYAALAVAFVVAAFKLWRPSVPEARKPARFRSEPFDDVALVS